MRVHYLQHVPYERPGIIEDWVKEGKHVLTRTQLFRSPEFPDLDEVDLLIVLGGPMGANDESEYSWLSREKGYVESALEAEVPVLGICLGAQIIASVLGADVHTAKYDEVGWFPIELTEEGKSHPLVRGWPDELDVLHWHGDAFEIPDGATHLATSDGCENQAFVHDDLALGLQFHVEMRPEDVRYMLDSAGDHGLRGPRVQEAETIREGVDRAERGNVLMKGTLKNLVGTETEA